MRHESLSRPGAASSEFAREVLAGLAGRAKSLPCRFFYDRTGSELFEDITRTPEYYPTRTETAILRDHAAALMEGAGDAVLVEFGSGSSTKTELLLAKAPDLVAYVPIDVSPSALDGAAARLSERFPRLDIAPVVADFSAPVELPEEFARRRRIGFFPGSTIGNFTPDEAGTLLATMGQTLGRGSRLIVGIDLRKDTRRLLSAYNDAEGITAAFNLNLLARINRELGGTFDLQFFRHEAIYDPQRSRVEMYLVSERVQTVEILGQPVHFAAEERIHTENSYKYSVWDFERLARTAGWTMHRRFSDPENLFCVVDLAAA